MTTAVYPGTFDPPTRGHLDLMVRGARLFDRLVVAVGGNSAKDPIFRSDERVGLLREATEGLANVEVESFDGLIVDYVRRKGASVILRGIRTFSDFEYEFGMALTNRAYARDIETVFVMPSEAYSYTSSRLIKEIAALGGDVGAYVTPTVARRLAERLSERAAAAAGGEA
ncbi:MAG: pantetheine-phosphate adenylyltransferase [Planctomycetes bacterium]|nr:pantetheine-phosphate adenylyltransferase [Planctomycetota bacterium]